MKLELYQSIILNRDVPDAHLREGDVATLVDYVPHPQGGEEGALLEIFNVLGESLRVASVPVSAIDALRPDLIPAARLLEPHS